MVTTQDSGIMMALTVQLLMHKTWYPLPHHATTSGTLSLIINRLKTCCNLTKKKKKIEKKYSDAFYKETHLWKEVILLLKLKP